MKILLMIDWCGQDETELYEVCSPSAETIKDFDGKFVNSEECSEAMNDWFDALYEDGNRKPMGADFKRLGKGPCGPFDAIVICGMLP